MATYDDFDGVYFTIQAIRLFHPEVAGDIRRALPHAGATARLPRRGPIVLASAGQRAEIERLPGVATNISRFVCARPSTCCSACTSRRSPVAGGPDAARG